MKFNHKFSLVNASDRQTVYSDGKKTAQIDFISDSCVRVAIFDGKSAMLPTFNVCPDNEMPLTGRDRLSLKGFSGSVPSKENADGRDIFSLKCGIDMTVDADNFLLKFTKDGKSLLSDRAPLAYNLENEFGEGNFHYVLRENGEKIFGLGDKGGDLDKSGRSFRIETSDCMGFDAETSDPLYKHYPFYICENSVGCYGIFYDTSDTSYFDFGKEINNYYEPFKFFKTEDDALVYYVFFGTKAEIVKQFITLCGKTAFPPKWSFDYCASTMAYTDAPDSENQMNGFIDKVKNIGLSCKGFYLSSGYTSIGNQRCVFNWNYDKFPDPARFIKHFSDNGIELIPNIKPAFLSTHPMYEMIKENGWFVKNPDSTPFVTQFWDGLGSYLDFTNPEAFNFWHDQVKEKLLDNGITATWNDNNEFDIKDPDALCHGFGSGEIKASRIRSMFTYLMNISSYTAQTEKRPELRPFLSSRSCSPAVHRIAQTWSGDNHTSWHDLKYCHFIGLTMAMSGIYFYGHDLGGFTGAMPSRELLLRWIQHGVFEPRFTIHSWNSDGSATMPWSYPDIIDSVKKIFAQRKRLTPYMYNCAYEAVENNEPINAPLNFYYDDKAIDLKGNSLMFGRDILVSFVLDENKTETEAYLPEKDDWYMGNCLYKGGEKLTVKIPADSEVPFFVRAGSVIATDEAPYGFESKEKTVFTVYPLTDGTFESKFFTDDGKTYKYLDGDCVKLTFTVCCEKDKVFVSYRNDGNMSFVPEIRLCSADRRELVID